MQTPAGKPRTPLEEFEYLIDAAKRDEHGGKVKLPIDLAEKLLQIVRDSTCPSARRPR